MEAIKDMGDQADDLFTTNVHHVSDVFWEADGESRNDNEMSFYDDEGHRHLFTAKW